MQPFLAASSFCWNCLSDFMTAGGVLEQLPSLILVSSQESSAYPGGAYIGIVSRIGYAPPVTVLFGHLQRQIVLSEPLWNPYFLTAGTASGKISLVQITSPFSGLRDFLHDHSGTIMVKTCFGGRFHTLSGHQSCKSKSPSCFFAPVGDDPLGYML